ncbi:hypothetical protein RIO-1_41 [Pseudoalteromonas phage RIO-1]|uniref:Uncharacterized protein n=1 Tax=Pseudoalteromonas phage RIO-1 TaxID=1316739 RepID=R4JN06_9CAUD|nr:hypothetical protein RIO-1_41 [Pseudoalteromonas phage RIO-1]AGK87055.1 hypothetical protein RIO-1_41 [Pseudoalteromonas phage RIO-1]
MSDLYQLYAFVTDKSWVDFLHTSWPDAPLINGYRVLVFTNQDYPRLKEQYPDFEEKELTTDETIAAMESSELGPFVHSLAETKQILNYFTPEVNEG